MLAFISLDIYYSESISTFFSVCALELKLAFKKSFHNLQLICIMKLEKVIVFADPFLP